MVNKYQIVQHTATTRAHRTHNGKKEAILHDTTDEEDNEFFFWSLEWAANLLRRGCECYWLLGLAVGDGVAAGGGADTAAGGLVGVVLGLVWTVVSFLLAVHRLGM